MRRLVFVTQTYDPDATVLGVTRDWVAALARRCAGVDVIAASVPGGTETAGAPVPTPSRVARWRCYATGRLDPGGAPGRKGDLPAVRVFSLGKAQGAGRAAQVVRLGRALAGTVPGAGAVFVHMVPRLAILAYPFAAVARRPLALWYAQGGVDRSLRLASHLADYVLTPTRDSFPLTGEGVERRLRVTGHGIDTSRYAPDETPPACPPRLLAAGRLSPSKRYDHLLDAVALMQDRDWRLRIAGPPLYPSDVTHAESLRERARALGLAERVDFLGAVPYEGMPAEYRGAWVLAHTSATGSLDKVVLEAMACGTPVISTAASSRTAFGSLAETLWCPDDRPAGIAGALAHALDWSQAQREEVGARARAVVEREHSLEGWARRVAGLLGVQ
jgi:glycosyltransferase involved in cell wall biosynthesis